MAFPPLFLASFFYSSKRLYFLGLKFYSTYIVGFTSLLLRFLWNVIQIICYIVLEIEGFSFWCDMVGNWDGTLGLLVSLTRKEICLKTKFQVLHSSIMKKNPYFWRKEWLQWWTVEVGIGTVNEVAMEKYMSFWVIEVYMVWDDEKASRNELM